MNILITSFEPFDGREVNQSQLVAQQVVNCLDFSIDSAVLPVTFKGCHQQVEAWLSAVAAAATTSITRNLVVSLGEAPIEDLRYECVAINKMHSPERGDNDAFKPFDQDVVEGGALALQAPVTGKRLHQYLNQHMSKYLSKDLSKHLSNQGEVIDLSYSAGQYVCNCLFYRTLTMQSAFSMSAVFFHIPVRMTESKKTDIARRISIFINAFRRGEL